MLEDELVRIIGRGRSRRWFLRNSARGAVAAGAAVAGGTGVLYHDKEDNWFNFLQRLAGRKWREKRDIMEFLPSYISRGEIVSRVRKYNEKNGAAEEGEKLDLPTSNGFELSYYAEKRDEDGNVVGYVLVDGENPDVGYKDMNERYRWVVDGLVAVEDKNFPLHDGISPRKTWNAVLQMALKRSRSVPGGSTLTQSIVGDLNDRYPGISGVEEKKTKILDATALEDYLQEKYESLLAQMVTGGVNEEDKGEVEDVEDRLTLEEKEYVELFKSDSLIYNREGEIVLRDIVRRLRKDEILLLGLNNAKFHYDKKVGYNNAIEDIFSHMDQYFEEGRRTLGNLLEGAVAGSESDIDSVNRLAVMQAMLARAYKRPSEYLNWPKRYVKAKVRKNDAEEELAKGKLPEGRRQELSDIISWCESEIEATRVDDDHGKYAGKTSRLGRILAQKDKTGDGFLWKTAYGTHYALVMMKRHGYLPDEFNLVHDSETISVAEFEMEVEEVKNILEEEIEKGVRFKDVERGIDEWYRESSDTDLEGMTELVLSQLKRGGLKVVIGYDAELTDALYFGLNAGWNQYRGREDIHDIKEDEVDNKVARAGIVMDGFGVERAIVGDWEYKKNTAPAGEEANGRQWDFTRRQKVAMGSTVKPIHLALAVGEGVVGKDDFVFAEESIYPNNEGDYYRTNLITNSGEIPSTAGVYFKGIKFGWIGDTIRKSVNTCAVTIYRALRKKLDSKGGYYKVFRRLFGEPLIECYSGRGLETSEELQVADELAYGEAAVTLEDLARVHQIFNEAEGKRLGQVPKRVHRILMVTDKDNNVLYRADIGRGSFITAVDDDSAGFVREVMRGGLRERDGIVGHGAGNEEIGVEGNPVITPDGTAYGTANTARTDYIPGLFMKTGTQAGEKGGLAVMGDGKYIVSVMFKNKDESDKRRLNGANAMRAAGFTHVKKQKVDLNKVLDEYKLMLDEVEDSVRYKVEGEGDLEFDKEYGRGVYRREYQKGDLERYGMEKPVEDVVEPENLGFRARTMQEILRDLGVPLIEEVPMVRFYMRGRHRRYELERMLLNCQLVLDGCRRMRRSSYSGRANAIADKVNDYKAAIGSAIYQDNLNIMSGRERYRADDLKVREERSSTPVAGILHKA